MLFSGCEKEEGNSIPINRAAAGGDATIFATNGQAFSQPAPNLSSTHLDKHMDGDLDFEAAFVSNPSPVNGGLGPIFNSTSCTGCHPTDGRAPFPNNLDGNNGLFLRISIPGTDEHGGPAGVPGFGTQLQHQANIGYAAEAKLEVRFEYSTETLSDGTKVELRKPVFSIINPYIPLPENTLTSPRIGMPVFGLGLLEAIKESDILAYADVDDRDEDGISGKPNMVWNPQTKQKELGRFGWKGGAPNVLIQTAGAYNGDMGITNPIFPTESSFGQSNFDTSSVSPEIDMQPLENAAFYTLTLAVPAARDQEDPHIIKGRKLFEKINCASCHVPSFKTGNYNGLPEVSHQVIYPYTDLLLHDMGEGLADNRPEFDADGQEWKTRPLWGIGLTYITSSAFIN